MNEIPTLPLPSFMLPRLSPYLSCREGGWYYGNTPLDTLLAAAPIPAGIAETDESARAMAYRWDTYVYEHHRSKGDPA